MASALIPRLFRLASLASSPKHTNPSRVFPMASALGALATNVSVSQALGLETDAAGKEKVRPAHHLNDTQTKFCNPWPSHRDVPGLLPLKVMVNQIRSPPVIPKDLSNLIPVHTPDWGNGAHHDSVKATWLGHACYLVEFPASHEGVRGPRILFDPALSHRCSPSQWAGPARITPVPCRIEDVPAIDAIVISHNHYDHTDTHTLQTLYRKYHPQVFAPLGNAPYFTSIGIAASHVHTLDWWDARVLSLTLPAPSGAKTEAQLTLTCLPSQHISNRGVLDRGATLWGAWAVADGAKKVYFAGDTGYRTVWDGEDEDAVPVCPAFKEVGERVGPFDLALIPIGAYAPRALFSNVHASPADSVRIFRDVKAKKALGMHWGTWVLTTEDIMEPPRLLKKECAALGIPEGDFDICGLGQTRFF